MANHNSERNKGLDAAAATRPKVTIDVGAVAAFLPACVEDDIKPILSRLGVRFDSCQSGSPVPQPYLEEYWAKMEAGRLVIPAGLVPRVREQLEAEGYQVRVVEHCPLAGKADRSAMALMSSSPWYDRLCPALDQHARGQLVVRGNEERLDILEALMRQFPTLGVFIAVRNRHEKQQLARRLRRQSPRRIYTDFEQACHDRPCTLVETYFHADSIGYNEDFDILVLADAQTATCRQILTGGVCGLPHMRIYAILNENDRIDSKQRLDLEAALGPVIFRSSRIRSCLPGTTVSYVGPFAYAADKYVDALERKRRHIWHNARRNAAIADIANTCLAYARPALAEYGLSGDVFAAADNENRSITVIVETPEHARELEKLLPGWPTLARHDGEPAVAPLRLERAIITWTRVMQDGLAADVLIRADGTGARHTTDLGPHAWANPRPMQIVDVVDDFDDQACRDVAARFKEYTERGFAVSATEAGGASH